MEILFIVALVITSIISVTYIVERGLALRWRKVIPAEVAEGILQFQSRSPEDLARLRWTCEAHPSPISRLLLFAADHREWSREENADVIQTRARHEVSRLERGLVVLEIIVGIAPLLGLVGTIYGLIILFGSMGGLDADQSAKFANGISVALNATLLGLIIAIPSLVAWSYYSKKVENLAVEMETLCDEFLREHYHGAVTPAPHRAEPETPEAQTQTQSPPADAAMANPDVASAPAPSRPMRVSPPPRRAAQA